MSDDDYGEEKLPSVKLFRFLPALVLLAGLFLGIGLSAEASGGSLEVVSQDARVGFSEGVTFSVEVEGDADVVEVKLNFRNANGGPWSYVYLDVEPSPSVQASYLLDTGGPIYVPPEGTIEYFYTIRDAENNVTRTPRQTLHYTDSRFNWESITVGPLILLYHDLPRRRVEAVQRELEDSLARVEDLLGSRPDTPMRGVIYNREDEVQEAFPRLSATIDEAQIFHGFAFPEWNLFAGIGLKPDLITHEVAHIMLHNVTDHAVQGLPGWLNEGFASYIESDSTARSARSLENLRPGQMTLRGMNAVPGRLSDIPFFYRKAESVVEHLVETHGEEKFRHFLGLFSEGAAIDNALILTYGFDRDGLEREWLTGSSAASQDSQREDGQRGDRQEGGGPANDTLFIQLESALLGAVVIFVVFVVLARTLYRRLVSRPYGDSVDDDYDPNWR